MEQLGNFLGRYQLVRVLGRGAMGVVYEGLDPKLNRQVAVKTILKSQMLDQQLAAEYSARFIREAQAVARLNHPNIVTVFDFGNEAEVAYLVMEFIRGKELKTYLDAKHLFGIAETVGIVCDLLEALDYAHNNGIIHRDIKPANVMLDGGGRVKLTDFGVARLSDSAGQEGTRAGTMVGTPSYMSPEQIKGMPVGAGADLFATGVLLYQCLSLQKPFIGNSEWDIWQKIVNEDPPPLATYRAMVPAALERTVLRALAKDPKDRHPSARALIAELKAAVAGATFDADATRLVGGRSAAPGGDQTGSVAPTRAGTQGGTGHHAAETGTNAGLQQTLPTQSHEIELEFWRSIKDSGDAEEFQLYLERFPSGSYSDLARRKMSKLVTGASMVRADQSGIDKSVAADASGARRLEELRAEESQAQARAQALAEQERMAEEAAARLENELAEQRRIDEAREQAEEARLEEEARAEQEALQKAILEAQRKAADEAEKEARRKAAREAEKVARRAAAEVAEKEAQRVAAEAAQKEAERKAAEAAEKEAQRKAAEAAEKEAQRKAAEAVEKEAQRKAAEAAQKEAQRKAAEAAEKEAQRKAAEAAQKEAQRKAAEAAEKEAQRKAADAAEKEAQRKAAEAAEKEAQRRAAEAGEKEAQRKAAEAAEKEAQRKAAEAAEKEAQRKAAEAVEKEAQRKAVEKEAQHRAAEAAEKEAQRKAAEAAEKAAQRKAAEAAEKEAQRKAAEAAEKEARRKSAEAAEKEAQRQSAEAAEREAQRQKAAREAAPAAASGSAGADEEFDSDRTIAASIGQAARLRAAEPGFHGELPAPAKSKVPLFIGAAVAAAVLIGGGVVVMSKKDAPQAPEMAGTAAPVVDAPQPKAAAHVDAPTPVSELPGADQAAQSKPDPKQELASRKGRDEEKALADKIAREKEMAMRTQAGSEAERAALQRKEAERLAAEKKEAERVAAARKDADHLATEKKDAERIAADKKEADRITAEKREADRLAAEKRDAERVAAEKKEADRLAAEKKNVASNADPDALFARAQASESEGRLAEAVRAYKLAYAAGSGQAARKLGDLYAGKGEIGRDYSEQQQWYRKAAAKGVAVPTESGTRR
jgi:tRNA A-37 threonylcarbamoyl transferase component Bud32